MSLSLDKSSWRRVAFGDVVRNVNEAVRDAASSGIDRVIAMEHLHPGEMRIRRWGSLDDGTTFSRRVRPGQTLFGKRRAYQRKAAYAEFDAICSGDILVFQADETQLLPVLLPFLVQSNPFFDHALGTSAGSLSPRTNWRDLAAFEFALPGRDEQKRIADLLWSVERERLSLHDLVRRLADAAAGWVNELGREAAAAALLSDVLETILDRRGITPKKLGGGFVSEGVPVLSAMNIVDGRIDRARQERYVVESVAKRWMSTWLHDGDILMTSEAPLGSTVLLREELRACLGQRLFALRPDKRRVLPEYLFAWLSSSAGQSALDERASGTTVKGIRQAELLKIEVPVPDARMQRVFVERWTNLQHATAQVRNRLLATSNLRTAILAEIFGGIHGQVQ